MFNFGNSVDRDTVDEVERVGDSRFSTNRQQIGNKVESNGDKVAKTGEKSATKSTVDFVGDLSPVLATLSPVCTGLKSRSRVSTRQNCYSASR